MTPYLYNVFFLQYIVISYCEYYVYDSILKDNYSR